MQSCEIIAFLKMGNLVTARDVGSFVRVHEANVRIFWYGNGRFVASALNPDMGMWANPSTCHLHCNTCLGLDVYSGRHPSITATTIAPV